MSSTKLNWIVLGIYGVVLDRCFNRMECYFPRIWSVVDVAIVVAKGIFFGGGGGIYTGSGRLYRTVYSHALCPIAV